MAALVSRLVAQSSTRLGRAVAAQRASPSPRGAPAPCTRRQRGLVAAALAAADFGDSGSDALSALADGDQPSGVASLATAAFRLAAGILAGIPASVALDEVADAHAARVESLTNAQTADGVRLHVSLPVSVHDGEPAPVVILIHQFFGLRERETALCDELARLGCVAIAPDVFQGKSTQWVPRALTLVGRATLGASGDWGAADLASVMRWVDAQPWGGHDCRLGVVGFCFGGGAALRFAEAHPGEVDAVASFYGAPLADAGRLNCPVFAAYGTADAQFPPAVVDGFEKHLSAAHLDATVLRYEGQPHAFVTDLAAIQAGGAPAEAWAAFLKFLRANALLPARPPVAKSW